MFTAMKSRANLSNKYTETTPFHVSNRMNLNKKSKQYGTKHLS